MEHQVLIVYRERFLFPEIVPVTAWVKLRNTC